MATTPLLWTGGWDSTFRLLTLLLREQREVQPYYILDSLHYRPAVPAEREAMRRIRQELSARHPEAAVRLADTIECPLGEIAADPEITRHYERCLAIGFIGGQYEWLARYCRQHGIEGMELSIHRDDKARELLAGLIAPSRDRLDPRFAGDCRYELFKSFRFPLFDLTKRQMQAEARAGGFESLMQLTWFCHKPRRGRPCGTCNPCIYTIEEGLSERVPLSGRLRYHFRVMPRLRHWLARHPDLYMRVRAVYRRLRHSLQARAGTSASGV
jgi:7-cyano-7-deazaguanine synthase in queuosine biosynthesis